ncbi:MAG TPA: malto-oligosyltrehalose synthase [Herpetosiphonaceae bacterium]
MTEIQTDPQLEEAIGRIVRERRLPRATYRFQFHAGWTFRDAAAQVPYLAALGVSDCYASPIFRAREGSAHGYDICDHRQLNPALGSREDFQALCDALRQHGMGLILDMVPNHMGIGDQANAWWLDVLENGPGSPYAAFFDIDWAPAKPELENKVLLPILGDQYGAVLEQGQLRLSYEGGFWLTYFEHRLPIAPRTTAAILQAALEHETLASAADDALADATLELQSIITALGYLPPRTERDPERLAERQREKEIIKRRLGALCEAQPAIADALQATLNQFNGDPADPRSFDRLDELIGAQPYRLAYWRVAADEINYRRFFDINDLAAIRVELPEVFEATHELIFELLREAPVSGLRIDHPDGLWNPPVYFRQLQERYLAQRVADELGRTPEEVRPAIGAWLDRLAATLRAAGKHQFLAGDEGADPWPLWVVAEKILSETEPLPFDWAVAGTTGYDFLTAANGLFVDPQHRKAFDAIYQQFSGRQINVETLLNAVKKRIMLVSLASEINALSHQLERVTEKNRRYRDFTLASLTFAIREVIACLPIYRTYVTEEQVVSLRDQQYVEQAVEEAKQRNPRTAESIFHFIRDTLLLRNLREFRPEDRPAVLDFTMTFQQITGPVMAKSFEDTTFYIYNRLVSLNEVGGQPMIFGLGVREFHRYNSDRQRHWPNTMLTLSTHDTKRSEDVRARINALSELPKEWKAAAGRWRRLNAAKKIAVDGQPAPDRNDEYLLYQTLVGAWPGGRLAGAELAAFCERIAEYMLKAAKEAKEHTSWINANEEYDAAVRQFVAGVLDPARNAGFLAELADFADRVAFWGRFNSLSQLLLKLAAPGVPDTYQGAELWDLSLVDPDNRRPVDYERRRAALASLRGREPSPELADELLAGAGDGRIKLHVLAATLAFRREHPQLFAVGGYLPLEASGPRHEHVCAFARVRGEEQALVIAPRLVVGLAGGEPVPPVGALWDDTWLALPEAAAGQRYRNLLTGEIVAVSDHNHAACLPLAAALARFPVALLERLD